MMKTFLTIKINDLIKNKSRRSEIDIVYADIIKMLDKYEKIEFDFEDLLFTPSLADELFGSLGQFLGAASFKKRVSFKNYSESQLSLLKHVMKKRLANKSKEEVTQYCR